MILCNHDPVHRKKDGAALRAPLNGSGGQWGWQCRCGGGLFVRTVSERGVECRKGSKSNGQAIRDMME